MFQLDPIQDPRWRAFIESEPAAAVFHTPAWLDALRRTYGYEPLVLTTANPGRGLTNGIVFCRICSAVTGHRLVSLPFSDHCQPLVEQTDDLTEILTEMIENLTRERYAEMRPRTSELGFPPEFAQVTEYRLHTLDLAPGLDDLFRSFHRDCIQRKIRRAERERLAVESGHSDYLLRQFYHLLLVTRRRLGVLAQPFAWFQNLAAAFGDDMEISVASKEGRPVASILTLRYKDTLVYKYGCCDAAQNRLGGMQLLFWRAIRQAKAFGIRKLDFGRSELSDVGLIAFKERWGCTRSSLLYWRWPASMSAAQPYKRALSVVKPVVTHIPLPVLPALGRLVARHLG